MTLVGTLSTNLKSNPHPIPSQASQGGEQQLRNAVGAQYAFPNHSIKNLTLL